MFIWRKIMIWGRNILIALFASSILAVFILKYVPVYFTPLMFIRLVEQFHDGKSLKLEHKWVPMEKIAQPLPQAVIASEDNLFMEHHGFDLNQIEKARSEAESGKRVRGASTISQQTVKNVFLWPGKSYVRKGIEAYFTVLVEFMWGKKRIMEVYLNSIEMGDGIYGAEAVAYAHFGKAAYQLNRRQAALIAASLPNPRRFDSSKPSPYMIRRQAKIMSIMSKLIQVKMGYGSENIDDDINTGKMKARKKWRASLITTSDASTIQRL
jgi:monofunctional glycosyltransferase